MASAFQLIPINAYFLLFGCVEVVEGPQAFRPKKRCPKNDVFLFFWGLLRLERGGMDLVWVKSVFWFVKYVDFYVIFL